MILFYLGLSREVPVRGFFFSRYNIHGTLFLENTKMAYSPEN